MNSINFQAYQDSEKSSFWHSVKQNLFQAIVAYFDIEFTHSHTYIGFSTSPQSTYTHWKQTFFFFDDFITAKKGEVINGIFRMKPNKRNKRDMDVEIDIDFKGEVSNFTEKNKYIIK